MGSSSGHVVAGTFFWGLGYFLCHQLMIQQFREQQEARRTGRKWTNLQRQGGGGGGEGEGGLVEPATTTNTTTTMEDDGDDDPISRVLFAYPRVMMVGIVGVLFVILFIEWPNAWWSPVLSTELHVHVPHLFLYTGYLMTMIAVLLERNHFLPKTSWTWMLAVANWIGYTVWGSHAKHQEGAESIFHTFMSEACLIAALFTMLLAMMQLCKLRDLMYAAAFLSFFMILLQGTIMFLIAVWYFHWYDPLHKNHFDVPEWQVPCVYAAGVFSSMAFMAGVWNYLRYKEETRTDVDRTNIAGDNDAHHDIEEETLPLS